MIPLARFDLYIGRLGMGNSVMGLQCSPDKTTLSFFEANAPTICNELLVWGREIGIVFAFQGLPDDAGRKTFLGTPHTPPDKAVLIPTFSGWCAYLDNDKIGGLPYSELFVLAERLHIRSVGVIIGDIAKAKRLKAPSGMVFILDDARRGEVLERSINLLYDYGRFEFHQQGQALPFEDVAAYQKRNKADRLTRQMLVNYGSFLGIKFDGSSDFYDCANAVGITRRDEKQKDVASAKTLISKLLTFPGIRTRWVPKIPSSG
jgi:hypothetical protein